jgi:hypothetical protein
MSKMTEVVVKSEAAYAARRSRNFSANRLSQHGWNEPLAPTSDYYGNSVNIESATHVPVNGMAYRPSPKPNQLHSQHTAVSEAHDAAWSYCRCALLFFIALIITWVPSTVNRVYSLVYPDSVSFPLNYVSALVLPLQGFWNCCIYITISRPACRELFYRIRISSWRNRPVKEPAGINLPLTSLIDRKDSIKTNERRVSESSGNESDRKDSMRMVRRISMSSGNESERNLVKDGV